MRALVSARSIRGRRGAPLNDEESCGLAEEQAVLRRVATLVARGVPPEEVFAAVTGEAARVLSAGSAHLGRYEPGNAVTFVAGWGVAAGDFPVGSQWSLGGKNVATRVSETGRPARLDRYADASGPIGTRARDWGVGSAAGAPVIVGGRLWGLIIVRAAEEQPLPPGIEARLAPFTELVATAVANAESRTRLARLAEEQAALHRVATLVARGAAPEEVFAAVAEEVGQLLPVDSATMGRYESDGTLTFVAHWGRAVARFPVGTRRTLGGHNLGTLVFESGRSVRVDDYTDSSSGALGLVVREAALRSAVGTPIIVDGRLWGLIAAGSSLAQPLPPDTETRLASFTELVATAIANAESRAELLASRARIVAAADAARRRIERDLHDGIQQQLVSLTLELRMAEAAESAGAEELRAQLARTAQGLGRVLDELQEISRGIHPAILSQGGLEPALRALARRSAVPVELDLRAGRRLPDPVEVVAYYAVSEALANVAKHAHASVVHVELGTPEAMVRLAIRDDGIGGADPARGSGLTGLGDRIEAVGGTLQVTSPAGSGTTLLIEIPAGSRGSPGTAPLCGGRRGGRTCRRPGRIGPCSGCPPSSRPGVGLIRAWTRQAPRWSWSGRPREFPPVPGCHLSLRSGRGIP
jgi:signal transduction histidine kinase